MSDFICIDCEKEVNPKRWALGYKICLECGALAASQEIEAKSKRVVLAYNKGSYQYAGKNPDPKNF